MFKTVFLYVVFIFIVIMYGGLINVAVFKAVLCVRSGKLYC